MLAIDDVEASVRTAETVRQHFPNLKIYARVRNRSHAYRLMELGIAVVWRETFFTAPRRWPASCSRAWACPTTPPTGRSSCSASTTSARLYSLFGEHRNEARMQMLAKKAAQELEELFAQDAASDRGQRS